MRRRLGVDYDRYHFIDASRESRERVKIAELLPTFFVLFFVFCFLFLEVFLLSIFITIRGRRGRFAIEVNPLRREVGFPRAQVSSSFPAIPLLLSVASQSRSSSISTAHRRLIVSDVCTDDITRASHRHKEEETRKTQ